jgi:glycosyltransferase involved in cell wall biosynthesis
MACMDRSVSILLPAHDEAAAITGVIEACRAHTPNLLEIVVVDDGSTDDTAALAERARARVIRLPHNQGKGAALARARGQLRGDIVVVLDADGQDDPAEIPLLLDALVDGVELVIGSRFMGRFRPGAISGVNRLGTVAINGLFNLAFGTKVTDTQAGFRALWRSTFDSLEFAAHHYDIETDMLCQIVARRGGVVEVPVTRSPRRGGQTDFSRVSDGLRIVRRIALVRLGLARL